MSQKILEGERQGFYASKQIPETIMTVSKSGAGFLLTVFFHLPDSTAKILRLFFRSDLLELVNSAKECVVLKFFWLMYFIRCPTHFDYALEVTEMQLYCSVSGYLKTTTFFALEVFFMIVVYLRMILRLHSIP